MLLIDRRTRMKHQKHVLKSCLVLAVSLGFSTASLSCVENKTNHYEGVHSFVVTAIPSNGSYGTETNPLVYPTEFSGSEGKCNETCYDLEIGAYAVDINGNNFKFGQTEPFLLTELETISFRYF